MLVAAAALDLWSMNGYRGQSLILQLIKVGTADIIQGGIDSCRHFKRVTLGGKEVVLTETGGHG